MLRKAWFALILAGLTFGADAQKFKKDAEYKTIGGPMPAIRLVRPVDLLAAEKNPATKFETIAFSQLAFSEKIPLIVMMFNPTCDHCEDMARALRDNRAMLGQTRVVLLSAPGMMPYLNYFDHATHVTEAPQTFVMGVDSAGFIDKAFIYDALPQINIYDANRRLRKIFTGIVPVDSLRPYLK